VFTLIYILSAAIGTPQCTRFSTVSLIQIIGIAVPILLTWHLFLVARGETSIESHDNDYFTKKAKKEGLVSLSN
jgi:palmitoyltransferase